jgi:hypothetical protein
MNVTPNPHFQLEMATARQHHRMRVAAAWRLAQQHPADATTGRRRPRLAAPPAVTADDPTAAAPRRVA